MWQFVTGLGTRSSEISHAKLEAWPMPLEVRQVVICDWSHHLDLGALAMDVDKRPIYNPEI